MDPQPTEPKIKAQSEQKMPFSVQSFRMVNSISVKYFQYSNYEKQVEEDYVIYRKPGWQAHGTLKTVIQLPGTAYVNFNTVNADVVYPGLLEQLDNDTQIVLAIFPNSPEQKFPTPILHLQRTIAHLLDNSEKYHVDQANIIFGGYSCGGTMTIPLATHFAAKSFFFKSLLLVSPIFDYSGVLRDDKELSARWEELQKKDNKKLTWEFVEFMNGIYSNSSADLTHPWYSPIYTPAQDLATLRNPCFVYGEYDFMRRSIEVFKEKLVQAKVPSQTILLQGEGHRTFVMVRQNNVNLQPSLEQAIKAKKLVTLLRVSQYVKKIFK